MSDPGADLSLRFAVLGPLRAWRPAGELALGRPQQRALLAALVLNAGRPMGESELLDAIWGDDRTDSAPAALRSLVARLGEALTSSDSEKPLGPAFGGYVLRVAPGSLDLDHFQQLNRDAAQARNAGLLERSGQLLDQALALVRGTPLASIPGPFAHYQRRALAALVLGAERQRLEIGLEGGRHREFLGTVTELVARHPWDEHLRELLMLTLYRCGRQAEAIKGYQDGWLDRGAAPSRTLQQLYERILRADPALDATTPRPTTDLLAAPSAEDEPKAEAQGWAPPRLLPQALADFVDRPRQWQGLSEASDPAANPGRLIVLAGPAGSGKTSLIAAWAHAMTERFPDGLLYGDLGGFSVAGPANTDELLTAFLRATGLPERDVPTDTATRATVFRERIQARRILLVLDNAARADDLHPFLPEPGTATTVVCSRHSLEDLVAGRGAAFIPVGHFTPDAAHELLRLRLGDARALADPRAARRLAELCDHLPLALSIAAARLVTRPAWALSDLVQELEKDQARLTSLGEPTKRSIERELDLSRRLLSPDAHRLVMLLSIHPGTEYDPWITATLLERPLASARHALDELTALHLLDEPTPGRYQAHDLVQAYCASLAERELTDTDRARTTDRLIEYYIAVGHAFANRKGSAGYANAPEAPPAGGVPALPTIAEGLKWFHPQEPAIRALILSAADAGLHRQACRLSENAGHLYYQSGSLLREWEQISMRALTAAQAADEVGRWAYLHSQYAFTLNERGRRSDALRYAEKAVTLAATGSDAKLRYFTRSCWATVLIANGQPRQALEQQQVSVAEAELLRSDRILAQALNNLADSWVALNEPAQALAPIQRSLRLLSGRTSDPFLVTSVQTHAEVLAQLDCFEEALAESLRALELGRQQGSRKFESYCAEFIGTQLHKLGRHTEARRYWQHALEQADEHGRPAQHLRALLAQN